VLEYKVEKYKKKYYDLKNKLFYLPCEVTNITKIIYKGYNYTDYPINIEKYFPKDMIKYDLSCRYAQDPRIILKNLHHQNYMILKNDTDIIHINEDIPILFHMDMDKNSNKGGNFISSPKDYYLNKYGYIFCINDNYKNMDRDFFNNYLCQPIIELKCTYEGHIDEMMCFMPYKKNSQDGRDDKDGQDSQNSRYKIWFYKIRDIKDAIDKKKILEELENDRQYNIRKICINLFGRELNEEEIKDNFVFFPIDLNIRTDEINTKENILYEPIDPPIFNRIWAELSDQIVLLFPKGNNDDYNNMIQDIVKKELKDIDFKNKKYIVDYINTEYYFHKNRNGGNLHCMTKQIY